MNTLDFTDALSSALSKWKREGKKGIWMTIPSSVSKFIPCAIELGFQFHHCMPDYVTLTQWIHATDESTLPLRPHHQIGVGGFVLNKQKTKASNSLLPYCGPPVVVGLSPAVSTWRTLNGPR